MKEPLFTERFIIRRFESADWSRFLAFMLDEESTRYLMFAIEQKTEQGAKALFDYVCASYESEEPIHSYAIADKRSNRYVGSCGYAPYEEGVFECYYSVNKEEEGRGVATEAIKALAATLAQKAEVRAYCHPDNRAAHAVAIKSGFVSLGLQQHQHFDTEGQLFVYDPSRQLSAGT